MSIYDFTVQKQDGTDQSMAEYQGQVLLIVNTAPVDWHHNTRNYRSYMIAIKTTVL